MDAYPTSSYPHSLPGYQSSSYLIHPGYQPNSFQDPIPRYPPSSYLNEGIGNQPTSYHGTHSGYQPSSPHGTHSGYQPSSYHGTHSVYQPSSPHGTHSGYQPSSYHGTRTGYQPSSYHGTHSVYQPSSPHGTHSEYQPSSYHGTRTGYQPSSFQFIPSGYTPSYCPDTNLGSPPSTSPVPPSGYQPFHQPTVIPPEQLETDTAAISQLMINSLNRRSQFQMEIIDEIYELRNYNMKLNAELDAGEDFYGHLDFLEEVHRLRWMKVRLDSRMSERIAERRTLSRALTRSNDSADVTTVSNPVSPHNMVTNREVYNRVEKLESDIKTFIKQLPNRSSSGEAASRGFDDRYPNTEIQYPHRHLLFPSTSCVDERYPPSCQTRQDQRATVTFAEPHVEDRYRPSTQSRKLHPGQEVSNHLQYPVSGMEAFHRDEKLYVFREHEEEKRVLSPDSQRNFDINLSEESQYGTYRNHMDDFDISSDSDTNMNSTREEDLKDYMLVLARPVRNQSGTILHFEVDEDASEITSATRLDKEKILQYIPQNRSIPVKVVPSQKQKSNNSSRRANHTTVRDIQAQVSPQSSDSRGSYIQLSECSIRFDHTRTATEAEDSPRGSDSDVAYIDLTERSIPLDHAWTDREVKEHVWHDTFMGHPTASRMDIQGDNNLYIPFQLVSSLLGPDGVATLGLPRSFDLGSNLYIPFKLVSADQIRLDGVQKFDLLAQARSRSGMNGEDGKITYMDYDQDAQEIQIRHGAPWEDPGKQFTVLEMNRADQGRMPTLDLSGITTYSDIIDRIYEGTVACFFPDRSGETYQYRSIRKDISRHGFLEKDPQEEWWNFELSDMREGFLATHHIDVPFKLVSANPARPEGVPRLDILGLVSQSDIDVARVNHNTIIGIEEHASNDSPSPRTDSTEASSEQDFEENASPSKLDEKPIPAKTAVKAEEAQSSTTNHVQNLRANMDATDPSTNEDGPKVNTINKIVSSDLEPNLSCVKLEETVASTNSLENMPSKPSTNGEARKPKTTMHVFIPGTNLDASEITGSKEIVLTDQDSDFSCVELEKTVANTTSVERMPSKPSTNQEASKGNIAKENVSNDPDSDLSCVELEEIVASTENVESMLSTPSTNNESSKSKHVSKPGTNNKHALKVNMMKETVSSDPDSDLSCVELEETVASIKPVEKMPSETSTGRKSPKSKHSPEQCINKAIPKDSTRKEVLSTDLDSDLSCIDLEETDANRKPVETMMSKPITNQGVPTTKAVKHTPKPRRNNDATKINTRKDIVSTELDSDLSCVDLEETVAKTKPVERMTSKQSTNREANTKSMESMSSKLLEETVVKSKTVERRPSEAKPITNKDASNSRHVPKASTNVNGPKVNTMKEIVSTDLESDLSCIELEETTVCTKPMKSSKPSGNQDAPKPQAKREIVSTDLESDLSGIDLEETVAWSHPVEKVSSKPIMNKDGSKPWHAPKTSTNKDIPEVNTTKEIVSTDLDSDISCIDLEKAVSSTKAMERMPSTNQDAQNPKTSTYASKHGSNKDAPQVYITKENVSTDPDSDLSCMELEEKVASTKPVDVFMKPTTKTSSVKTEKPSSMKDALKPSSKKEIVSTDTDSDLSCLCLEENIASTQLQKGRMTKQVAQVIPAKPVKPIAVKPMINTEKMKPRTNSRVPKPTNAILMVQRRKCRKNNEKQKAESRSSTASDTVSIDLDSSDLSCVDHPAVKTERTTSRKVFVSADLDSDVSSVELEEKMAKQAPKHGTNKDVPRVGTTKEIVTTDLDSDLSCIELIESVKNIIPSKPIATKQTPAFPGKPAVKTTIHAPKPLSTNRYAPKSMTTKNAPKHVQMIKERTTGQINRKSKAFLASETESESSSTDSNGKNCGGPASTTIQDFVYESTSSEDPVNQKIPAKSVTAVQKSKKPPYGKSDGSDSNSNRVQTFVYDSCSDGPGIPKAKPPHSSDGGNEIVIVLSSDPESSNIPDKDIGNGTKDCQGQAPMYESSSSDDPVPEALYRSTNRRQIFAATSCDSQSDDLDMGNGDCQAPDVTNMKSKEKIIPAKPVAVKKATKPATKSIPAVKTDILLKKWRTSRTVSKPIATRNAPKQMGKLPPKPSTNREVPKPKTTNQAPKLGTKNDTPQVKPTKKAVSTDEDSDLSCVYL